MNARDLESYLFPEPDLLEMTNDELRRVIQRDLPQALDMTDGSDMNSDLKIDIAQDLIHQACDILMDRGENAYRGAAIHFHHTYGHALADLERYFFYRVSVFRG